MTEWQNGLCGCFNDCGLCVITLCLPCYTYGKNAEAVDKSCFLYCLIAYIPVVNTFCGALIRGEVREQKGIDGSCLGDLLAFMCCPICALVQIGQEVSVSKQQSMALDKGEALSRR